MKDNLTFQVENERLLEKLEGVHSFNGWKALGKFVKKGQRQKAFRVQSGTRPYTDPITGDTRPEPIYKLAYGFTSDQVF